MIKLNYNVGFNEATSTFTASFNDAIIIGSDGSSAISEMVTPGSEVMSIQIGKGAKGNVFKGAIYYSRFGNYFQNNIVGHYMYWSEFGHYVHHVIMGQDENNTISGIKSITIENGVGYVNLYKDGISGNIENIKICSGVLGTSTNRVMIGVDVAAPKYQIIYANNSSGALKKYCEADLIN